MGQDSSPAFFSEKEAAVYLSVSLSTMRRWRRISNGPEFFRFGGVLREVKHPNRLRARGEGRHRLGRLGCRLQVAGCRLGSTWRASTGGR